MRLGSCQDISEQRSAAFALQVQGRLHGTIDGRCPFAGEIADKAAHVRVPQIMSRIQQIVTAASRAKQHK